MWPSKLIIVRADILVMIILHPKAFGNCPKLVKADALVKVAGMGVAFHHGIESVSPFHPLKSVTFQIRLPFWRSL